MHNSNYHLTDSELLNKYGINGCPSRGTLTMHMIILYCHKNDISIPVNEGKEKLIAFIEDLLIKLPCNYQGSLQHFLDIDTLCDREEFRWSHYLTSLVPREEFLSEYPLILSVLCDMLHVDHEDLESIKLEWAVKMYLCGERIDIHNFVGEGDALHNFILGELLASQEQPEVESQTCVQIDEETQMQVADDWELNDYWEPLYDVENEVDVIKLRDFTEDLVTGLDRYYERGGYHAIFQYDEQISRNPSRCNVLKSLMEHGFLNEVITDGRNIVCTIGVYGGFDAVTFKFFDGQNIIPYESVPEPVPYSVIASTAYSLFPSYYIEEIAEDGKELVALGELCEIGTDSIEELIEDPKNYNSLPRYYFSSDLQDIYNNAQNPKHYRVSLQASVFKGPHLHVNNQGEILLNKLPGYYMCPVEAGQALRIKDDLVSYDYLTYALYHNDGLRRFLSSNPPEEALLKRKVAIYKDRETQDAIIAEYFDKTSGIVSTDSVYKVAIVDDEFGEGEFDAWGLEETQYSHVKGEEGILFAIENGDEQLDAIIIDAKVDSVRDRYKGLRELLSIVRKRGIPVFVYTDVQKSFLQDDLYDEEYQYIISGHYFNKSEANSIEKLVKALRDELDGEDNVLAKIRGEYIREFAAAEWLDQKFAKLNLVSSLTYCLSQPNKSFTTLRGVLNNLYKLIMTELSNGSGLDKVKKVGVLPLLLRDRSLKYDNQVVFYIKGDVMPLPLAASLCYATQIVNGGVHEEDEKMDIKGYLSQVRSENLAHAVVRITLDFVLWLREVNLEFDGYCESEDMNELYAVKCRGLLQQAGPNEYFCETEDYERIHVLVKGKVILGAEIEIMKVKHETKLRDKYKWITYSWNYKTECD